MKFYVAVGLFVLVAEMLIIGVTKLLTQDYLWFALNMFSSVVWFSVLALFVTKYDVKLRRD